MLKRVYERWKLVLELIIQARGKNHLVKKHRGLKSKLLDDLPTIPDSDDKDEVEAILKSVTEGVVVLGINDGVGITD